MSSTRYTFWVLILVVSIAGLSQGLSIPLLAVLLEQQGVSTVMNGLNAAALYIGMVLISPWLEIPLRRIGYRSTILVGMVLLTIATALIPLFSHLIVWFFLRMLMGIGDSSLHYSSQMWVTKIASPKTRGRDLSMYGLAYGVGFSVGPLGLNLLPLGIWVPFGTLLVLYVVAFILLARIKNEFPDKIVQTEKKQNKYATVLRVGWLALIPSFLYGFMETSLNGSFPVYALRTGLSIEWVSLILPSFVVGSIILQMPLGSLSDRIGRKQVMLVCAIVGGIAFFLFPLSGENVYVMMVLLAIAGAAVGSFYSLGLAYSADLLPASMVPTAGIIAGINFGVASILAPNVNGVLMQVWEPWTIFWLMGALLIVFAAACLFNRQANSDKDQLQVQLQK
ncbi:putative MFS-type transporter YfkF [Brevibacillus reuszeri]|uniref:MFS transporter n=1 Tax=Brevibacillus reuszeri TaxID=54915 RepID=A0A0K9YLZ4_9BACL|nr:MFS transporter [Brevibacillus reuszeri]KNB69719.1 MFS transporter [Brevibacillus reuszeri]MED1858060.1 MFS transporter [Brevibacillus reuszeri]GED68948.1 putative MFS-type transporter YfkF [Brevibacillus reuszeri]